VPSWRDLIGDQYRFLAIDLSMRRVFLKACPAFQLATTTITIAPTPN
jgi:hypothetical protein